MFLIYNTLYIKLYKYHNIYDPKWIPVPGPPGLP